MRIVLLVLWSLSVLAQPRKGLSDLERVTEDGTRIFEVNYCTHSRAALPATVVVSMISLCIVLIPVLHFRADSVVSKSWKRRIDQSTESALQSHVFA
ncbi:hypothetical protein BJV78DRAFT_56922 [Lactifluus subvellereus]|nr:hypothetical protein BJV78DRAFT_56922 [Lactifluus subvellereus]